MKAVADRGGKVRVLSNTIISPSTNLVINDFIGSLGGEVAEMGAPVVAPIVSDSVDAIVAPIISDVTGVDVEPVVCE